MLRIGPSPGMRVQEMSRNRRACKQMIGGGVCGGCQSSASASAASAASAGQTLHTLEIETVLLQMAGNILPGEAVYTHELHYGLGDGVLDPQVCHSVHKALVELWGPHEAGPLERAGGLFPARTRPQVGRIGEFGRGVGVGRGGGRQGGRRRRWRGMWWLRRLWGLLVLGATWVVGVVVSDVKGQGKIRSD